MVEAEVAGGDLFFNVRLSSFDILVVLLLLLVVVACCCCCCCCCCCGGRFRRGLE